MILKRLKCSTSITENLDALEYNFGLLDDAIDDFVAPDLLAMVAYTGNFTDVIGSPQLAGYETTDDFESLLEDTILTTYTFKDTVADSTALPGSPTAGDVYYLTDPGKTVYWDGEEWQPIADPLKLDGYLADVDIGSISVDEINTLFPSRV